MFRVAGAAASSKMHHGHTSCCRLFFLEDTALVAADTSATAAARQSRSPAMLTGHCTGTQACFKQSFHVQSPPHDRMSGLSQSCG